VSAVARYLFWTRKNLFLGSFLFLSGVAFGLKSVRAEPIFYFGALLGLGAVLAFVLAYLHNVHHFKISLGRGELGQLLLLPQGPTRVAWGSALLGTALMSAVLLATAAVLVAGLYREVPSLLGDGTRVLLYLLGSLATAAGGIGALGSAVAVAYGGGRLATVFSVLAMMGAMEIYWRLALHPELQRLPRVPVSDLGRIFLELSPLGMGGLPAVSDLWPSTPLLLGPIFGVLGTWLAARILEEAEA